MEYNTLSNNCRDIVQYCTKESIVYNTLKIQACNILSYML